MSAEDYHYNLSQLSNQLVEKNKILTQAMKSKQKHAELLRIFEDIKNIYQQIGNLRDIYITQ